LGVLAGTITWVVSIWGTRGLPQCPARWTPCPTGGKNTWGLPPCAEVPANLGGKAGSVVAVKPVLYAPEGAFTGRTIARTLFMPADLAPKKHCQAG
jgi:hypothetical protein